MGCIALVRCVLMLRCGSAGVVWYPDAGFSHHTSNQSNTTHEITHQISRKLLRMDVLTSETCWAVNNKIIKQVTLSWSLFIQLSVQLVTDISCSLILGWVWQQLESHKVLKFMRDARFSQQYSVMSVRKRFPQNSKGTVWLRLSSLEVRELEAAWMKREINQQQ